LTATWDRVQTFLTALGELKEPELYSTGLEYVSNLIQDIHDIDHNEGEAISRRLSRGRAWKEIDGFLRKLGR